jgi:hypothetical protein
VASTPDEGDRREIESALDLLLWRRTGGGLKLAGTALAASPPPSAGAAPEAAPRRLALRETGQEACTWERLIEDRLACGGGVPVLDVGARLAPEGAGRAEITNLAARHIHALRSRLEDGAAAILTERHAYRLSRDLAVGIVAPRPGGRL